MKIVETSIPDVKILKPSVFNDERGYFLETWQQNKFDQFLPGLNFLQDNESFSSRGTLRGIHLQINHPQGKLVRVVKGEVYDVAIDLRPESPSCGEWVGRKLDSVNKELLWIPPGFGHAFYTLSEDAIFTYKCTEIYHQDDQYTLAWDDPTANIEWPTGLETPALSDKDLNGMSFDQILEIIESTTSAK